MQTKSVWVHTCEAVVHYFNPFDTRFDGIHIVCEGCVCQVHDQVYSIMLSIFIITIQILECARWAHIDGHSQCNNVGVIRPLHYTPLYFIWLSPTFYHHFSHISPFIIIFVRKLFLFFDKVNAFCSERLSRRYVSQGFSKLIFCKEDLKKN